MNKQHTAIGAGGIALASIMAFGASTMPSESGYAGIGPNFLPWVVSIVIGMCGVLLLLQGLRGGFTQLEANDDSEHGHWRGFAWVSAGLLLNAALITTMGFILSCSLLFMLAVRGFRHGQGQSNLGYLGFVKDALVGALIAAPVFWMFGMGLDITLPSLTGTPWL